MRKRKVWTAQDDEDLRYWHACRLTDGRIAKKMGCCRRTVLRQREAMGLVAVGHPKRIDRFGADHIHKRPTGIQAEKCAPRVTLRSGASAVLGINGIRAL